MRRLVCKIFYIGVIFLIPLVVFSFQPTVTSKSTTTSYCRACRSNNHNENANIDDSAENNNDSLDDEYAFATSRKRRDLLLSTTSSCIGLTGVISPSSASAPAKAVSVDDVSNKGKKGLYVLDTRDDESTPSVSTVAVGVLPKSSPEYALLRVLPIKNAVFRTIQTELLALSVLRQENIDKAWAKADSSIDTSLSILISKRSKLEPVFNPDDSTEVTILKAERGEILLSDLTQDLEYLKESIHRKNITCTFEKQRSALLHLGFLGELLVKEYPYKVPYKGKYSFLPRLLGRAKVTFRFKRAGNILGDVQIVADGYTAPITAGNFVDLCLRNFYTGLPIKETTKKVGSSYQDNIPSRNILGSFGEGFYSPLTGQLRKIPLEIIRTSIEGSQKLSYSYSRRFAESSDFEETKAKFLLAMTSKPLLTFEIPGLIALNHPSGNPNGGSSEFFGLQSSSLKDNSIKRSLLDGQYAPFGYIIRGFDVFDSLRPGDVIDSTSVDEFGELNLVKIRSSTFKEVSQGTEKATSKKLEEKSVAD